MIQILLFIIAYILYLPLTIINWFFVDNKKGYFLSSATNLDKFGNREFRTLWNNTLIVKGGYKFGNINETISSVLGKNERDSTLTKAGRILVWILYKIDKGHARKSINDSML
jgi:hypothetical protein